MEMKLLINENQKVFFTSDTHYNHTNLVRGITKWSGGNTVRDFDTLEYMNSTIVDNINHLVGENDILFHLGDWSFGGFESIEEFRSRIVCKNIHLVLGNHDHHISKNKGGSQELFSSVNDVLMLTLVRPGKNRGDKHIKSRFLLSHYPFASWMGMADFVIHLHGHMHSSPIDKIHKGKAMDAGLDGNDLDPYLSEEIVKLMKGRPIAGITLNTDHHERNL